MSAFQSKIVLQDATEHSSSSDKPQAMQEPLRHEGKIAR